MRLKLGDALSRREVASHIFETSAEAHRSVFKQADEAEIL